MLRRAVPLLSCILLSTALADTLVIKAAGLPASVRGTVMVGKDTAALGSSMKLAPGTYRVTPAPVAVGGRVFTAAPTRVVVRGTTAVTLTYSKLKPGSPDPLFGTGGMKQVLLKGMETSDNWTVVTSGADLPIVSTAGGWGDAKAILVSMNGQALGAPSQVSSRERYLDGNYIPSPVISDGSGYLGGLSYVRGTVVRWGTQGQYDASYKTGPESAMFVRGLLRLPDRSLLAYGGQTSPAIWHLKPDGAADTAFGDSGVRSLSKMDPLIQNDGIVVAARSVPQGIRLVVVNRNALLIIDLDKNLTPTVVAPGIQLPFDIKRVRLNKDGSLYALTADVLKNKAQLVRVLSTGRTDPKFSSPVIGGILDASALAIQQDGQIVTSYFPPLVADPNLLIRFNADGSVDKSFGTDGRVYLRERVVGMDVGGDGKLKVVTYGRLKPLEQDTSFIHVWRLLTE